MPKTRNHIIHDSPDHSDALGEPNQRANYRTATGFSETAGLTAQFEGRERRSGRPE